MPSCTRAPPESLMKINGEPVFSECIMISATLVECTSPAAPPATVKSWLAKCTSLPAIDPAPVTTPSAGISFPSIPNRVERCSANSPLSSKLSGSTSSSIRSRADILPALCCFSILSAPPPSIIFARRFFSSSTFFCIGRCCFLFQSRHHSLSLCWGNSHFVRGSVELHLVRNGLSHRTVAVAIASGMRRRRAQASLADLCPGSWGPALGWRRTSPPPGEHGVGQHVLVGAVAALQFDRWVRNSGHSGFSRSAGRTSMACFLACVRRLLDQRRIARADGLAVVAQHQVREFRRRAPYSAPAAR